MSTLPRLRTRYSRRENSLGVRWIRFPLRATVRVARSIFEITDPHHGLPEFRSAPQEDSDPCGQLGEGEGLDEVIVRADVEPTDAVLDGIFRREDQNRHPAALFADLGQDLEPVHERDQNVQNDHVVGVVQGLMERVAPVARNVDGEALLDQPSADEAGHRPVVFHQEDAHEIS